MDQVREIPMADVEEGIDEGGDDELILGQRPLDIVPLAQIPEPEVSPPKLWRIFFAMQAGFILFTLDIAFAPLNKFACNPYKGLSWNYDNNTTIKDERCQGQGCWEKQVRCLENCNAYQDWLTQIRENPREDSNKAPSALYPNPLCFPWEIGTVEDLNFPVRKFNSLKLRAEELEWHRRTGLFWNVTSLIILLVWFVIFCSQCTEDYKLTCIFLFGISVGMYYTGNYLALKSIDVLKCFHPVQNSTTLEVEFWPFCDDTVTVAQKRSNGDQPVTNVVIVHLPPMPTSWTISRIILGIRSMVPLVYIFLWGAHALFGPEFFRHMPTTKVEFAIWKIWGMVRRR